MLHDIFNYLFIRKATYTTLEEVLKAEGFIYTKKDIETILKGNQKGTRYGNMVLFKNEHDKERKRFFKVVLDGTWRTYRLFQRQVKISEVLHNDKEYKAPALAVLSYSFKGPLPYAVFETRENGEDFGFMNDSIEYYEKFTDGEIKNLVKTLYSFYMVGNHADPIIWQYTRNISSDISFYTKEFLVFLNATITHKKIDGEIVKDKVKNILKTYIPLNDVSEKIISTLENNWKMVSVPKTSNIKYLVHADMAVDNIYKHPNGTIELLDFEWVSQTNSLVVAIMYDYGNLRARAWSSPKFQAQLDTMMLEIGVKYHDINIIKAGLHLGILRSSLMMSRFHLDFINTVTKDRRTEENYFTMFPKSVESLKNVLTQ